jgi:hypothetical protein
MTSETEYLSNILKGSITEYILTLLKSDQLSPRFLARSDFNEISAEIDGICE